MLVTVKVRQIIVKWLCFQSLLILCNESSVFKLECGKNLGIVVRCLRAKLFGAQ